MANPTTVATNRQPTSTAAPHVVTPPRPAVSQITLGEVLKARREVRRAEKALKALKDALAERERAVIQSLESGATVAHGILTAEVHHEERRNVKWRVVAEEYLGADFCELVTEETEPATYTKLVIA